MGKLIKGKGYSYYVPDVVDDTTTAFIYYPGSGGADPDANVLYQTIKDGNPNQIIIIADVATENIKTASERYFNLINQIGNDNGATISNVVTMGFSAGGYNCFNGLVNNIVAHPEAGPQCGVFVDVSKSTNNAVSDDKIPILRENGSTLLFFEPQGTVEPFESKLAAGGVDVVIAWASGNHSTHINLNKEALQNGIVGLTSAEIEELANSDTYTFVKYNATTGKWDQITMAEVAEKFANLVIDPNDPFRYYKKLGNLQELQCNNEFIGSKVNSMRNAIKNTNFLTSTSFDSYSSTTNIPNGEIDIIQSYFTACSELLSYIEKDTVKLIQIGNSIKDMNEGLKKEASDLNNSINYYNNTTTVTTGNNGTVTTGNNYNYYDTGTTTNTVVSSGIGGITGAVVGSAGGNLVSEANEEELNTKIKEIKENFLKYDELYSDTEKVVYQKDDDYKIVIHYENDKILTLEYYFDYKTEEAAKEAMKTMKTKFEGVEDTINDGQYVKVIFNEDVYKGLTLDEIKKMYNDLKELVKEDK